MVTGEAAGAPAPERTFPPIAEVAVISMALVVIGGIYTAGYLPDRAPMGVAIGLLAAAAAILIGDLVALSRVKDFAWDRFFLVVRWTLVAYVVIAGMLEYVFVVDGVRGSLLVVMSMMLLIFAVDVPLILGFSVARYQDPDPAARG